MKTKHLTTYAAFLAGSSLNAAISVFIQGAPIELDSIPTATIYNGAQDTMLHAGGNADVNFGAATELSVDDDTERHVLIQFDDVFGTDPGQVPFSNHIIEASLLFFTIDETIGEILAFEIVNSWDANTATFNNFGPEPNNGISPSEVGDYVDSFSNPPLFDGTGFDVTDSYRKWQITPTLNNGFALVTNSDDGWDFPSTEEIDFGPVLIIEHAPVPEPSTYALVAGICVLGVAVYSRRTRK